MTTSQAIDFLPGVIFAALIATGNSWWVTAFTLFFLGYHYVIGQRHGWARGFEDGRNLRDGQRPQ